MFELLATDLLGRNGIIHTEKGKIRTPCFVPVVHPEHLRNLVNVKDFQNKFNIELIITSSYILKKRFPNQVINLHEITDFNGPIITDSGAYQSLVYGQIDITPESVIEYQERINSDFAVPLDVPISLNDSHDAAASKIQQTIQRCQEVPKLIKSSKTKWIGPIQGGRYLDLVKNSAIEISKISIFDMYAIGSVVEIMNNYMYDSLIDIILTAKQYLDPAKPIHLFGAGHPSMFPLIIAAGCDSFDSAAYTLYAQEDRYLTNTQTFLLKELEEFPCNCPICSSYTPEEISKKHKDERMSLLAAHNLYVCQTEMKNIRRAIKSGTLWNLLEIRAQAHPSLKRGFNRLLEYSEILFKNSPSTKNKGIFLTSANDLKRSEIMLHKKRLQNLAFKNRKKLVLFSSLNTEIEEIYDIFKFIKENILRKNNVHQKYEFWILSDYFGIIPIEISEVYPISQSVFIKKLLRENLLETLKELELFINKWNFIEVIIIGNLSPFFRIEEKQTIINFGKLPVKAYSLTINKNSMKELETILNLIVI